MCTTVVSPWCQVQEGCRRCGFQSVRRYNLLTSKRQRLIFGRLTRYGSRWLGSSPGRRRATTPSIHLGVPDSLSVTPGNGGIWQQLGWSTVCVTSTPTAHTFFSCAFCQRACPSLLSQLSFRLQSSRHALTSRTCVAQAQHEALRIVFGPKSSHLIAQCHTSHCT